MRINISIDDTLLRDFDAYCDRYRYNRSELMSRLMRDVVYNVHTDTSTTPENIPNKEMSDVVEEMGTNHVNGVEFGPSDDLSIITIEEECEMGYCKRHFEKGVQHRVMKIKVCDPEDRVQFKDYVCASCLEGFKRDVKNNGGTLTVL